MSQEANTNNSTPLKLDKDAVWVEFGAWIMEALGKLFHSIGLSVLILKETFLCIIQGKIDWQQTLGQAASIGFDSLPMTLLICTISGSVLALQSAEKFALTGADAYVGGLVSLAIVREMAPIFACLAVGARSGTAIAAELANMAVTEQISALQIMHVSPVRYLVVPRLIACVIALPMLTFIGEVVGILGGMVVAQQVSKLHYIKYLESVWLYLSRRDIQISMVKAMIFGLILATISCKVGMYAKGGARDVGLSTTRAVVWVAITIIVADFFLTWIFFGSSYESGY